MTPAPLSCPKCKAALAGNMLNLAGLEPCPSCRTPIQVHAYPALFRPTATVRAGELVMMDGESSCFYHPAKKAIRPCEGCGRFVCALCDCELHGQHFCPVCLEVGKKKGKIKSLDNQRTLYDSIALGLATIPIIAWPITCITAPAALYLSIRHWNSPTGLIRRSKTRFVVAIIFATLQITGWAIVIFTLLNAPSAANG